MTTVASTIKSVWVKAHNVRKGQWVEEKVPTGRKTRGFFGGEKDELEKKRRWVEFDEVHDHLVDGKRLAADVEQVLNLLAQENYEIVSIMPVTSGRYAWEKYSSASAVSGGAATCASWGYSVTEGVMITSQKKK